LRFFDDDDDATFANNKPNAVKIEETQPDAGRHPHSTLSLLPTLATLSFRLPLRGCVSSVDAHGYVSRQTDRQTCVCSLQNTSRRHNYHVIATAVATRTCAQFMVYTLRRILLSIVLRQYGGWLRKLNSTGNYGHRCETPLRSGCTIHT